MIKSGLILPIVLLLSTVNAQQVAFLKENQLIVTDSEGANPRRIDKDPRRKSMLRADRIHGRMSYLTDPQGRELARVVVLDLNGNIQSEKAIRTRTYPETLSMRFVEVMEWLPSGRLWLGGSVNPNNCEVFDFDPDAGTESHWSFGKCGSFARSPDGEHTARVGTIPPVPLGDRSDVIVLDNGEESSPRSILYPQSPARLLVLAGPVWSPAGDRIAILERRTSDGSVAVVVMNLKGEAARIPLPGVQFELSSALDRIDSVAWGAEGILATLDRATLVAIDPDHPERSATNDPTQVEPRVREQAVRSHDAVSARAVARKFGSEEGVLISPLAPIP